MAFWFLPASHTNSQKLLIPVIPNLSIRSRSRNRPTRWLVGVFTRPISIGRLRSCWAELLPDLSQYLMSYILFLQNSSNLLFARFLRIYKCDILPSFTLSHRRIGVGDRNHNHSRPQSEFFWDHIKCNWSQISDQIKCKWDQIKCNQTAIMQTRPG